MLPFWFTAWAMATSPSSAPETAEVIGAVPAERSSLALLFAAVLAVPLVGYGARYLVPAAPSIERMREIATAATLICGVALILVRLVVERRSLERAGRRIRLLATACEQAGELIVIVRQNSIEYANDAFCQATGYSREDLVNLPPMRLVAPESKMDVPALRERLMARQVLRATAMMARKDGSTFEAALSAAPILDGRGGRHS
jgi:PAS domain S-box-containing protein